jgi:acetyl esterase/lipase
MRKLSIFIIGYMICLNQINAQTMAINIWKGQIPGSIKNSSYKEMLDTSGGWERISNVSIPRIDFYSAPSEKSTGTAVLICPGGGYGVLATGHEGKDIAKWFNSLGISAFVLKYRLPDETIMTDKTIGPLQDAQQAMRIIRQNSKDWNINPEKIGVMGFSAGGHLAATLSTHYNDKVYEADFSTSARPDFSILIYPVISMDSTITHMGSRINLLGKKPTDEIVARYSNELQVNKKTPPAFLVHSIDDGAVPVENSINYVLALRKSKVPCELHLYQSGGHGYGMGRSSNTESTWPEACIKWLKMNNLL